MKCRRAPAWQRATENWKLATGKFSLAFAITNTTESHPYDRTSCTHTQYQILYGNYQVASATWPTLGGYGQTFSLVSLVVGRLVGEVGFEARRKCICNAVDGVVSDRKPVSLSRSVSLSISTYLSRTHFSACVPVF